MRGYSCNVYTKNNGKLEKNHNTACFAGIKNYYISFDILNKENEILYISDFREKETEEYIDLLIRIINKITPCKIVKISNKEYIEIKLLKTYDQSLVILNFIRNLWYKISKLYSKGENSYNKEFFKVLKTSRKYKDALERLTYANLEACKILEIGSTGHSNTHHHSTLKIKSTEQLFNYGGICTRTFLTS